MCIINRSPLKQVSRDRRIMGGKMLLLLVFTSLCFGIVKSNLPPLTIEAMTPRGMKIEMQDDGFSSFLLIVNLKSNLRTTQWRVSVPKPKGGYWTSIDRNIDLRIGDVLDYNVFVIKNYQQLQEYGSWTVYHLVPDTQYLNCDISETRTPCSNQICKNTLIFSEEFNDDAISEWKNEVMFPQEPDYPFNAYTEEAIRVQNGTLIIKPEISNYGSNENFDESWDLGSSCTGEFGTRECLQKPSGAQILPPITSGKVSTKGHFSFKYGRIDVRAKLPAGEWLIPEINLEPLNNEYGKNNYMSGLMRIAYLRGNEAFSRDLYGGPMVSDAEPYRSVHLKKYSNSYKWNSDFHVYSLIWRPEGFEMLVDNISYGLFNLNTKMDEATERLMYSMPRAEIWQRGTPIAPLDHMFYISLGVRVGGINDFADSPLKPWKNSSSKAMYNFWKHTTSLSFDWPAAELIVDYVRVYSL